MISGREIDLKINGDETLQGGSYDNIKVNGSLNLRGNTDCNAMKVNGNLNISGNTLVENESKLNGRFYSEGNTYIGDFRVNGRADIKKNLEGNILKVNGTVEIGDNLEVKDISIHGHTKVNGYVNGERIDLKGYINVMKDCNVENFTSQGAFNIKCMLNADIINIELYEFNSSVGEIGGEVISIKRGTSLFFYNIKSIINSFIKAESSKYLMNVNSIEGDDIYVEYTKAKIIRGKNISIGPECEIDRVECSGEFKRDSASIVRELNKEEYSTSLVKDE